MMKSFVSRAKYSCRAKFLVPIFITLFSMTAWAAGRTSQPLGPEFQVNSVPSDVAVMIDDHVAVAGASNGSFVVVRTSYLDGSGSGIYAQRYDANGLPMGAEFQVNTTTLSDQTSPAIAVNSDGSFVITWQSQGQDGSGWGIFAQRYDSSGNPLGTEFQVNTSTIGNQSNPAISFSGNFVITWESDGDIKAQLSNSNGLPIGSEIQVNTEILYNQISPDVAMAQDGSFVITWDIDNYQNGTNFDVYAQRFDALGNYAGSEFRVNTYLLGDQQGTAIGISPTGSFVIAWEDNGSIHARRYAANGSPVGSEFVVGDTSGCGDTLPDVAVEPDGSFVVSWTNCDVSFSGIAAQQYTANGQKQGQMFQVNDSTYVDQRYPSVTAPINDRFVIVWLSSHLSGQWEYVDAFAKIYVP